MRGCSCPAGRVAPAGLSRCHRVPRSHLILHTARTRGYPKVMTGESCTRVAVKLLTNLALGRGAFLAVDTVSTPEGAALPSGGVPSSVAVPRQPPTHPPACRGLWTAATAT